MSTRGVIGNEEKELLMQTDLFSNTAESFWIKSVHKKERSAYGQTFLDKNRKRFAGQNRRILDYIMIPGNELDSSMCRKWEPEIWNLNSRSSDLINKMGFRISKKPHATKNLTVCYCTPDQIEYNKKLIEQSINQ